MNLTGVILAGGKSTRMGKDKGLLLIKGKPMVQYVIDALLQITPNIMIISNNEDYNKFGLQVYPDLIKDKGPVGGIYTALAVSNTNINLCVSCDTPFVEKELLNLLVEKSLNYAVTISKSNERIHPLIGVYKKEGLSCFKSHLDKGQLKLIKVIDDMTNNVLNANDYKIADINYTNVNTLIDLKKIENECRG